MHFATFVLGADPIATISRHGIYRDGSEEEHEDGEFDYAVPRGMFSRLLVLAQPKPRPKILGFLPAGYTNKCFSCELKELDIDATLSGFQPLAIVNENGWLYLPEERCSSKEQIKELFAKLSPSTRVTVFDCHA